MYNTCICLTCWCDALLWLWLNFSQPFVFEDADSFFKHSCRHAIDRCGISYLFVPLSLEFLNLGMRISWNPASFTPATLIILISVYIKPFFSIAFDFFTSQTDTTLKSTTLSLWTSNIAYISPILCTVAWRIKAAISG